MKGRLHLPQRPIAMRLVVIVAAVAIPLLAARGDSPRRAVLPVGPIPAVGASGREGTVNLDLLKMAALTPDDLGSEFVIADETGRDNPTSIFRFLVQLGLDPHFELDSEQVYLIIVADPSLDPDTIADSGIAALRERSNLEDVIVGERLMSGWLAPGAVACQISARGGVRAVAGQLYAWQQGQVVALLLLITNTGDSKQAIAKATRYAELQRDKLTAALAAAGSE